MTLGDAVRYVRARAKTLHALSPAFHDSVAVALIELDEFERGADLRERLSDSGLAQLAAYDAYFILLTTKVTP